MNEQPSNIVGLDGKTPAGEPKNIVGLDGKPATPQPQEPVKIQPFPGEDYVFKFTENPVKNGTYVLFTSAGMTVAVTPFPPIAEFLCEAARMLYLAHKAANAERAAAAAATPSEEAK